MTPSAEPQSSAWLVRWGPILPLLLAEFILWVGFGALLPVLPLYTTHHGVDLANLGLVVAAWPAARLVFEPVFGWIADRTRRKPLMVIALIVTAGLIPLNLVSYGIVPFLVIRALTGAATAVYDPAARGFLVDATPADRQGEAFGLYSAAQMGGLLFGPAIGGLGAYATHSDGFVFVFCGIATALAGLAVLALIHERPRSRAGTTVPSEGVGEMAATADGRARDGEIALDDAGRPVRLVNRLLIVAIVVNLGSNFATGTYEVAWSLFLTSRGAGLDLIGATFAMFAVPMILLSPWAGRVVDRRGSLLFIILGSLAPSIAAVLYTVMPDVRLAIPIILFESAGIAIAYPALYAIVSAASPAGRSATAQGLFGAAGTVGFILSSVIAGWLATFDLRLPFWFSSFTGAVALSLSMVVGARAILDLAARRQTAREARPEGAVGGPVL
ncbi:MAG TPA: MFS transporter [Candidatus Limnocylindrales bacterium]|nr:MFS transporter [Candidatus Limnocylindrales bacterium]